jgi:uncharacterized protein YutE (UPF0331/DUF86 family)
MTPELISKRVVADRMALLGELLEDIRRLPLADRNLFFADRRNISSAESCLRRSLEALVDIGRHILAKGFATAVTEYKEVAVRLEQHGVLSKDDAALLRLLAGYRNRLVHFYHEVSTEELYQICSEELTDIERIIFGYRVWASEHPEKLDAAL